MKNKAIETTTVNNSLYFKYEQLLNEYEKEQENLLEKLRQLPEDLVTEYD